MPKFSYWGTDEQGVERRGEVEAAGVLDAARRLRGQGLSLSSLDRVDPVEEPRLTEEMDAFAFFNRSLAGMTRIGFPLPRAVREISRGLRRGRFKASLERLESFLREGKSLEESVADLPGDFPPHYRWMLRAGAKAGNLPAVLTAVARNTEGFLRVRRALAGALAYPAVILGFGGLLMAGFVAFFLPMLERMQLEKGFPEPTLAVRIAGVVANSAVLQASLLAGVVVTGVAVWLWATRTVGGERFLFRVPVLGSVRKNLIVARFLGCLAVLLRARAPLVDALPVALGASGSLQLARDAERLQTLAREGAGLADVLKEAGVVPQGIVSYLLLAERSGDVQTAAAELSELMTEQALGGSETLYLVLMPVSLILTGALVCALVVSLVLPYVRFVEQIGT